MPPSAVLEVHVLLVAKQLGFSFLPQWMSSTPRLALLDQWTIELFLSFFFFSVWFICLSAWPLYLLYHCSKKKQTNMLMLDPLICTHIHNTRTSNLQNCMVTIVMLHCVHVYVIVENTNNTNHTHSGCAPYLLLHPWYATLLTQNKSVCSVTINICMQEFI